MRRILLFLGVALAGPGASVSVLAQPVTAAGAEQRASASVRGSGQSVPAAQQLWRKAVWHGLDLREKANRPLFAQGHWVTSFLVAAVKRGELTPYPSDSCLQPLPLAVFRERLRLPGADSGVTAAERAAGFTTSDVGADGNSTDNAPAWTTIPGTQRPPAAPAGRAELLPRQLYQLEVKEQLIFNQRHSRMQHLIESVTIVLPAAETQRGYDAPLASFRYADLVRIFRAHPEEAIWFNTQNSAQHRNLADAFGLWLFASRIIKVENADDQTLAEIAGGNRAGLFAGQEAAGKLIEFEDQLWSR